MTNRPGTPTQVVDSTGFASGYLGDEEAGADWYCGQAGGLLTTEIASASSEFREEGIDVESNASPPAEADERTPLMRSLPSSSVHSGSESQPWSSSLAVNKYGRSTFGQTVSHPRHMRRRLMEDGPAL